MDVILSSVKCLLALMYLNDIVVFWKTVKQHLNPLRRVLALLRNSGVTLNLQKRLFFDKTINYLGHVTQRERLEMVETTTRAIQEVQYPTTQTAVRYFLVLCNIYRRFVPRLSKLAVPLNKMLRKEEHKAFQTLTEAETQSVDALKNALTNPPVLDVPRANGQYTIDTDACDTQAGSVLLQIQDDGSHRLIGYCSRALSDSERKLATTHTECLAVL